tara:strand:- start:910 stop:1065 length:156 start_codon:yes stop_codon:yes gene_type:complete
MKINSFFYMKLCYLYHDFLFNIKLKDDLVKAPVAQLDRALGYGPGGSGFKS